MNGTGKIKILYIDDEPNNLFGFKATFRLQYDVLTATSADAGFALLNKHPDVIVILCDQKMPGKTGVQFFEEVAVSHPAPIRILLTGYTDIESVINAINRGHIYRYISKPWQEADIHSAIEEGYKYYMTTSMLHTRSQELEQAYAELDKFTYNVTHYLRSPLVSVIGALDLAKQTDSPEELKHILSMMETSLRSMDELIKSIHEYHNINRGELNIESIDFHAVSQDLERAYRETAEKAQVQFDVLVNQSETFRSDRTLLELILNNLLSNAFKYQRNDNSAKFVALRVDVSRGNAVIVIEDNGIGIEKSQKEHIFKMFYRASSQREGSGLGLYNVYGTLKKLNGNISVTSTVGSGSVFKITIPGK